ncbi:hypothetical protein ACVI1N_005562 [Sinorhizobium medicae]
MTFEVPIVPKSIVLGGYVVNELTSRNSTPSIGGNQPAMSVIRRTLPCSYVDCV